MTLLFGFLAGVFSTLSPCVLPLLPLVVAPAMSAHRLGLLALTSGLALSFVLVGLFVATIGFSIGLDGDLFRTFGAALLALIGLVLLSGPLQQRFAQASGGVSNGASRLITRLTPNGLSGQFLMGMLLGAVWSPCVGPTLGAASVLAAQQRDLLQVAAVMLLFGCGTALPLLLVGLLSREAFRRWRGHLLGAGKTGKAVMGGAAVAVSLLILTGFDRSLETVLVAASPAWLTDLTTRF
jgi:cytochrome c biogenesis protein CcdA